MIEDNIDKMIEEMRQLKVKKGPHYDKWLKNYTESVTSHCMKIADHYKQRDWLSGMEAFLRYERTRRNKQGQS